MRAGRFRTLFSRKNNKTNNFKMSASKPFPTRDDAVNQLAFRLWLEEDTGRYTERMMSVSSGRWSHPWYAPSVVAEPESSRIYCKFCGMKIGTGEERWDCQQCSQFSVCGTCHTEKGERIHYEGAHQFIAVAHYISRCSACENGIERDTFLWRCQHCNYFVLCANCEQSGLLDRHFDGKHIFAKMVKR